MARYKQIIESKVKLDNKPITFYKIKFKIFGKEVKLFPYQVDVAKLIKTKIEEQKKYIEQEYSRLRLEERWMK